MPDHALTASPWWKRLLTLEPAVVRGVIGALVLVLALWGVDAADLGARVEQSVTALLALVPLVTAWWTRAAVTPAARVVQSVEPNGDVVAGPASALPTGIVIRREGDEPGAVYPLAD